MILSQYSQSWKEKYLSDYNWGEKCLVYIESSLQLDSALTLIRNHKPDSCVVQFLINIPKNTKAQFQISGQLNIIAKEFKLTVLKGEPYRKYIALAYFLRNKVTDFTSLVAGHYYSDFTWLLRSILRYSHFILVDDGTDTLWVHHCLSDKSLTHFITPRSARLKIKSFFFRILFFRFHDVIHNVTMFTSFSLVSTKNCKIIENNHAWGGQTIDTAVSNDTLIMGSTLVQLGVLSMHDQKRYYRNVVNRLGLTSVMYIPHRHEKEDNYLSLCKELGFELLATDDSVQNYLANCNTIPKYYLSFMSTAIFILCRILPKSTKIVCIKLPIASTEEFLMEKRLAVMYENLRVNEKVSIVRP